jgi:hypothetical protein
MGIGYSSLFLLTYCGYSWQAGGGEGFDTHGVGTFPVKVPEYVTTS